MVEESVFRNVLVFFNKLGIYDVVLPFLLTFWAQIVYGLRDVMFVWNNFFQMGESCCESLFSRIWKGVFPE